MIKSLLLILVVLTILFRDVLFDPAAVQFNNDTPLGYWMDPHQGWNDNNWLGYRSQPMNPTAMTIMHTPVVIILLLAAFALWCGYRLWKGHSIMQPVRFVWACFAWWMLVKLIYVMFHGPQHHDIFVSCAPFLGVAIAFTGFLIAPSVEPTPENKLPWWARSGVASTKQPD